MARPNTAAPSTDIATSESGPLSTPIAGLFKATPERRNAALASGTLARQIVTLQPGDALEGKLIGPGAPVEVKSPDGELAPCATWNFDMGRGITVGILGSHQLDSEFPTYLGRNLYVEKGESKSVGSRRVNQYMIIDRDTPPPTATA